MGAKKYGVLALSFLTVLLLDLITKEYVVAHFPLYDSRTIVPGFFNLVHYRNKGVAFGLFAGSASPWREAALLLFSLTAVIGILLFAFSRYSKSVLVLCALGGVLGGALGNLLDRFRFGGVVDFLDFSLRGYHWPAFNIADSAISVGVLYLFFHFARHKDP